jgi:hypothetical protein
LSRIVNWMSKPETIGRGFWTFSGTINTGLLRDPSPWKSLGKVALTGMCL